MNYDRDNDLLAVTKFRNARLQALIDSTDTSVAEFCKRHDISQSRVGEFLNLKALPWRADGTPTVVAAKLCEITGVDFEELFPATLYSLALPDQVRRTFNSSKIMSLEAARELKLLPSVDGELESKLNHDVDNDLLSRALFGAIHTLPSRTETALRMRFGLDSREHTLEEVGTRLGVTPERARQIVNYGLRVLRHPSRAKQIKKYLPLVD